VEEEFCILGLWKFYEPHYELLPVQFTVISPI